MVLYIYKVAEANLFAIVVLFKELLSGALNEVERSEKGRGGGGASQLATTNIKKPSDSLSLSHCDAKAREVSGTSCRLPPASCLFPLYIRIYFS